MRTASKTSRISSASPGWRSQYSLMVGFSPRLQRARNSSAKSSTGLRASLDEVMASLPIVVKKNRRLKREPVAGTGDEDHFFCAFAWSSAISFWKSRAAAEGVEVRLLQFVGPAPPGADGVAEGSDGLVREHRGLGGRHTGLCFRAQPCQQGQCPRSFEPRLGIRGRVFGPQLDGPPQVGGGLGRLPGPDQGPAPIGVAEAEIRPVLRVFRDRLDQLLVDGQAVVDSGEGLGESLVAGEHPAKIAVGSRKDALVAWGGGVSVGQPLGDGQRLAVRHHRLLRPPR